MITNTAPFDISHHPAMAIPCGMADGLPVSVMLVGKHWDEPTIYRAAAAFEGAGQRHQIGVLEIRAHRNAARDAISKASADESTS